MPSRIALPSSSKKESFTPLDSSRAAIFTAPFRPNTCEKPVRKWQSLATSQGRMLESILLFITCNNQANLWPACHALLHSQVLPRLQSEKSLNQHSAAFFSHCSLHQIPSTSLKAKQSIGNYEHEPDSIYTHNKEQEGFSRWTRFKEIRLAMYMPNK